MLYGTTSHTNNYGSSASYKKKLGIPSKDIMVKGEETKEDNIIRGREKEWVTEQEPGKVNLRLAFTGKS